MQKNDRILAIAPSSRGFGFAVLESEQTLVDWGVKSVTGKKNAGALTKVEAMIALYKPAVLVLEDAAAKGSRRTLRIRKLTTNVTAMAGTHRIKVALLSRDQIMRVFFEDAKGTKYTIARVLAGRYPEELGHRLPSRRQPWESEDYRMGIFDAVALVFAKQLQDMR
ncbi:MAG TPA: hypothetical protein VGO59_19085 [Verrucomicrobiae bacterium]